MRRSVKEASIGFSILAATVGGIGLWFWLSGVVFGSKSWPIRLRFLDAAGLAPGSSIIFRGVPVGSVKTVTHLGDAVLVTAQINDPQLILPRPISAQVRSGSLLGGDSQVALETTALINPKTEGPLASNCDPVLVVCANGMVQGVTTPSLTSVMGMMQNLLAKAEKENIIGKGAITLTEVSKTSKAFGVTAKRTDAVLISGNQLVTQLQQAVKEADPVIKNLKMATAQANATLKHTNNIVSAFDNPKTINELKRTVSNAEQLTRRIDAIGGDVQQLSGDPSFVDGLRSVTLGLGKFFDELYPEIRKINK
jgi:phospholipid/cholesterol/gamma-HCH transport system substrate-binding protein